MSRVLVIGAGGVGSVAVHKMAQLPEVFSSITLASRRISSCDKIAESVKQRFGVKIETAGVLMQMKSDKLSVCSSRLSQIF